MKHGLNIMLIDDDEGCLKVMSRALELFKFNNRQFNSPSRAIEAFRNGDFNLVVTDFKMGEMDGLEVIKQIKKIDPRIRVIMLTGLTGANSQSRAEDIGVYAYFPKPLDMKTFLGTISRLEEEIVAGRMENFKE
ncbi:response regulator [bacterium]|nr:response regulator [bacterium]